MSRLLGFVRTGINPLIGEPYSPEDPPNYWIWQATEFPPQPEWDYERLQIQTLPALDGNMLVRVLGPHTPRVLDGVFLHMHMNALHRPQPKTSAELDPALQASWDAAIERLQPIAPRDGMT